MYIQVFLDYEYVLYRVCLLALQGQALQGQRFWDMRNWDSFCDSLHEKDVSVKM